MGVVKDPSHLLDVERQAYPAWRPGFRIAEHTINHTQKVPWHCHSNVQDTFYVLEGHLQIFLREPKEEVRLAPDEGRCHSSLSDGMRPIKKDHGLGPDGEGHRGILARREIRYLCGHSCCSRFSGVLQIA